MILPKDLNKNFFFKSIYFTAALIISGCAAGDGNGDNGGGNNGGNNGGNTSQSSFTLNARTNSRGIAEVQFNLPKSSSKVGVTAISADSNNMVVFDRFVDDQGNNFLSSTRNSRISLATTELHELNVAVAPSRNLDPNLVDDARYTVRIQLAGTNVDDKAVQFSVISKADGSLNNGRLTVNLIYVGTIGGSDVAITTVREASNVFSSIYNAAGISVDFTEQSVDGLNVIADPFTGSAFIENLANQKTNGGLNILIAGDVSESGVLGIAGGIPGPLFPSRRSAVAISIVNSAGSDGDFSNDDIRILGETMAHESGHFLGLFHPVDFSNRIVDGEDPLTDTPVCSALTDCVLIDSLVSNLMFVAPVQRNDGSFVEQQTTTPQQQSVLNRNPLVD